MQPPLAAITIYPSSQRLVLFFILLSHGLAMCLLLLAELPFMCLLFLQALIIVMVLGSVAVRKLQSGWLIQLGRFNPDELEPRIRVFSHCGLGGSESKLTQASKTLMEAKLLSHFYLPGIIILTAEVPKACWPSLLGNYRPWLQRFLLISLFLSNLGRSRYHVILTGEGAQGSGAEAIRCLRSRLKIGRW